MGSVERIDTGGFQEALDRISQARDAFRNSGADNSGVRRHAGSMGRTGKERFSGRLPHTEGGAPG